MKPAEMRPLLEDLGSRWRKHKEIDISTHEDFVQLQAAIIGLYRIDSVLKGESLTVRLSRSESDNEFATRLETLCGIMEDEIRENRKTIDSLLRVSK